MPQLAPDDGRRAMAFANPDDPALTHLAVVGDTYTVLLSGEDTAGRFALIDMLIPAGGGPPPHRHAFEEIFTSSRAVEVTLRDDQRTAAGGGDGEHPRQRPARVPQPRGRARAAAVMVTPAGLERFFAEFGDRVEPDRRAARAVRARTHGADAARRESAAQLRHGDPALKQRRDACANRERVLDVATDRCCSDGEKSRWPTSPAEAGRRRHPLPAFPDARAACSRRSSNAPSRSLLENARDDGRARRHRARRRPPVLHRSAPRPRPLRPAAARRPAHVQRRDRRPARRGPRRAQTILDRGVAAGELRGDVTPIDVIVAGALLSRPLPNVEQWDDIAARQIELFLAGISA